ncbi:ribonucleoside-triphosphate reductase, adenosylcobalamin-dependent [Streptomyces sp. NBC_01751]|uniref:ribonucleoside-triphosphate reductase, adenosylcobalamin-dependent n=1 Tax=Streptomyces sp. NBC_01751 TaxID=2975929 RepID=UPI002DD80DF0|nr:ribonucleoside-triphosphate reductase, adenosylcobalamin-dependent [Streptomyces sp. NBC_01751]WSD23359.1 ribonucleoside-triphosphate reductase, adenosylcobalamin-dependent [Streptomyces sp. NBC_01751]
MSTAHPPKFGPTGETVYERTYQRVKANGERESWADTVTRVVDGNLSLVPEKHREPGERERLIELMYDFKVLPAGRHLWASGVPGRQYLFNCHVSGWGEKLSDHFEFTFMRLMEGGGVGANYSSRFLAPYGAPVRPLNVHIVADPAHPDYAAMKAAGVLSVDYSHEWGGAFAVEDSREGWAAALVDLLDTYGRQDVKHVDRVYDVSRVREEGAPLRTFGGTASGPRPFARMMLDIAAVMNGSKGDHLTPLEAMEIDHAIAECVVSGGNRRSARMSMVEWNDPHIFDFIACKTDTGKHWTTNISVVITDEFISALNGFKGWDKHSAYAPEVHAQRVHTAAVKGMLDNGEPGYWNSSLSNVGEPNEVIATNPCGEIALEPWENCNLGHVNLDAFAPKKTDGDGDLEGILEAHRLMARFLIRATYGDVNDPKQRETLARNRRIGVGHFGVQGYLAKQGVRYSAAPKFFRFPYELRIMQNEVKAAAAAYCHDLRIPVPVKATTVAPTGTIAKMPGVTEGIHPIYARHFIRRVRFSLVDPVQAERVNDFFAQGHKVETDVYDQSGNTVVVEFPTKEKLVEEVESLGLPADLVESAAEISFADMLAFQAMYQKNYTDNAVSFTVNVLPGQLSQGEAEETLARFLPVLKGTTVFPDLTRPQSPYERITAEEYEEAAAKSVDASYDEACASGACPVK